MTSAVNPLQRLSGSNRLDHNPCKTVKYLYRTGRYCLRIMGIVEGVTS